MHKNILLFKSMTPATPPPPPPIQIFQGSQGFGTSLRIQPPLQVPRP